MIAAAATGKPGQQHPASAPAGAPARATHKNLLVNGGFERHNGVGTIPVGWEALDQNFDYLNWIAPRVERLIGDVSPRSGRYMIGLATDMLGVDTNDKEYHIARSAIYQTITVPGNTRGTFSLYYNDLGSSALSHIAAIRLAYTVNSRDISAIKFPKDFMNNLSHVRLEPGRWSKPYFRVSQMLPLTQTALGDWSLASIPVAIESTEPTVRLTLWIGIFEHQGSTELGYYRIDDAAFTIDQATTQPSD